MKNKGAVFIDTTAWYRRAKELGSTPLVKQTMNYLNKHYELENIVFFTNLNIDEDPVEIPKLYSKATQCGGKIIDVQDQHENLFLFTMIEEIAIYTTSIPESERNTHTIVIMSGDWRFARFAEHLQSIGFDILIYAADGTIASDLLEKLPVRTFQVTQNDSLSTELAFKIVRQEVIKNLRYTETNNKPTSVKSLTGIINKRTSISEASIKKVITDMVKENLLVLTPVDYDGQPRTLLKANWTEIEKQEREQLA